MCKESVYFIQENFPEMAALMIDFRRFLIWHPLQLHFTESFTRSTTVSNGKPTQCLSPLEAGNKRRKVVGITYNPNKVMTK